MEKSLASMILPFCRPVRRSPPIPAIAQTGLWQADGGAHFLNQSQGKVVPSALHGFAIDFPWMGVTNPSLLICVKLFQRASLKPTEPNSKTHAPANLLAMQPWIEPRTRHMKPLGKSGHATGLRFGNRHSRLARKERRRAQRSSQAVAEARGSCGVGCAQDKWRFLSTPHAVALLRLASRHWDVDGHIARYSDTAWLQLLRTEWDVQMPVGLNCNQRRHALDSAE